MKRASLGVIVGALTISVGLVHCSSSSSTGGTSAPFLVLPDGSAPTPSGCVPTPLALQPASGWTQSIGTASPACTPPNPVEKSFADVVSGVELTATSNQANCCACTERSKAFMMASKLAVSGTTLDGVFAAARGQADTFSVASFRITVKNGGSTIGSRVFAREDRPNNNCIGSGERPETVINELFTIQLSSFATGAAQFDEVDVDLQGYACGAAAESAIALVDLRVSTCGTTPPPVADSGAPDSGSGTSVTFFPVGCDNPTNPNVNVQSEVCPNGPNLTTKTTVTCTVSPCPSGTSGCSVTGALTANGNVAVANCSGLAGVCATIAQTDPNPQVTINDRVPCN